MLPKLRLQKNEERRLLAGHLWIYSNEVDIKQTPLKGFTPGELVRIETHHGKFLAIGYINPHALISVRILSRKSLTIDAAFFQARLQQALTLREQVYDTPFYRMVYGESDGLPGLIIDRFNDALVLQITTAGMEQLTPLLAEVLPQILPNVSILLRNDAPIRELENLPLTTLPLLGNPPQEVTIIENSCEFVVPIWEGQKTGWFYDHRANRQWLIPYAKNKRILDVFSYLGGWGIQLAAAGASDVTCIDSSQSALALAQKNIELNQVETRVHLLEDDAFTALERLHQAGEKYDMVIIDPPAFIKSRKHYQEGLQGYHRLNDLALMLVDTNGWLISASCSMHLTAETLLDIIRRAGLIQQRDLKIISQGHQAPDHPVHPAMPETNYLKMFTAQVS